MIQRVRDMLQFILRRLGLVIPTFIGITLLTFAFVHMIPGDPVTIMAGNAVSPPSATRS